MNIQDVPGFQPDPNDPNNPNAWEVEPKLKNRAIATVRTVLPAAWSTAAIYGIEKVFKVDISPENELLLAPVVAGAIAVGYNIIREIEARWPVVGRIFIGVLKKPAYSGAPPA